MASCDLMYDKTCNVSTVTTARVDGSQQQTDVVLYTGIKCTFQGKKNTSMNSGTLAVQEDVLRYELYLPIAYKDIRKGYIVELIEEAGHSIGKYIVEAVDVFTFDGLPDDVDNVYCVLGPR